MELKKRLRILIVSPFVYGSGVAHGGGVVCFTQLQQLAKHHSIAFLCFTETKLDSPENEIKQLDGIKDYCDWVETVPFGFSKNKSIMANISSLALKLPRAAYLWHSSEFSSTLLSAIIKYKPDIVWIQFPQMAQYVSVCSSVKTVMDVQDAYSISCFRRARLKNGLRGCREWFDWLCWVRYEARFYEQFSSVLTLSEQDATVLRALNPATQVTSTGLPLGFSVPPAARPVPFRVGFAGSFAHPPNVEGLTWFLDCIWPRIIKTIPEARFVVAGRNPPHALVARSDTTVEFAGFVPDIAEFYASNSVTVVPLLSGGGVKVKTVEAMLAGSAVVSTPIGIEGTGAQNRLNALIAADADGVANAVISVLRDSSLRDCLAAAALSLASRNFSVDAWGEKVDAILAGLVS